MKFDQMDVIKRLKWQEVDTCRVLRKIVKLDEPLRKSIDKGNEFGWNQQQKDYISNENSRLSFLQLQQSVKIQDSTKENQTLKESSKQCE
jgi:hypothetical protein